MLASVWTAIAWAAGLTLLGLSLLLAWWLGKRQAVARYQKQPAVPAAQHLAAAGVGQRHQGGELVPAAVSERHEHHQPADEDEEEPDIEGLFQHDQGLETWDEPQLRKPVARRKWDYRPC